MIEVTGLTKLYDGLVAVEDLSFAVAAGEVVGMVGPNGAGKTTTLRSMVGIIRPNAGVIRIAGHDLAAEPVAAKRALAFIPDEPHLFDYLTVAEHLRFIARLYGVPDAPPRIEQLLEEVELADRRNSFPDELSRGMKQKLAIACGLLHSPKVIYFDEPLTGLDPIGIRRMKQTVLARAKAGAAVIVSSHLLHLVEEICDRVLILHHGRSVLSGTLDEVRAAAGGGDVSLEDVFFRITEGPGGSTPTA